MKKWEKKVSSNVMVRGDEVRNGGWKSEAHIFQEINEGGEKRHFQQEISDELIRSREEKGQEKKRISNGESADSGRVKTKKTTIN